MARMIALTPPPEVTIAQGPYKLIAPEAGYYANGLRFTSHLFNGVLQDTQSLDATTLDRYVKTLSQAHQLAPADVKQAVLALVDACEGVLRQMATLQGAQPQTQATRLVELVEGSGAELFHTPDKEPYATVPVAQHRETWHVRARSFRLWLARLYYEAEEASPNADALQSALNTLQGICLFDGAEIQVYTRLAEHQGTIYLDLANEAWQAVCVTSGGWCVIDHSPVKFRRMPGMLSLPTPTRGGKLQALRALINVDSTGDSDWQLIAHWLLAALRPRGPYPILVVHGGHGSAKSTLVRILRSLVDPHTVALRRPPKDERDIVIAATNSWVFALDNLSRLPDWLSDALCCLSTGTGFATRSLYTDGEEALFTATRPTIVNGIEEIATRADFLDRAIIVHLPPLPADKVRDEETLWGDVEKARPQILGACFDIIGTALQALPTVKLDKAPRMADFARWSCAAAPACGWKADAFLTAYNEARVASHTLTLDAALIWPPLQALLVQHNPWDGTATDLLAALWTRVDDATRSQREWPKKASVLANSLRRLQPTLKEVDVIVEFYRDQTLQRNRRIRLKKN